jgi:hypothetical protein
MLLFCLMFLSFNVCATTFSITTFFMTTFSDMDLIVTLSINDIYHNNTQHKELTALNWVSDCKVFVLSVVMLSVVMLSIVMLSVLAPKVCYISVKYCYQLNKRTLTEVEGSVQLTSLLRLLVL